LIAFGGQIHQEQEQVGELALDFLLH
jgi:hypothetical protein